MKNKKHKVLIADDYESDRLFLRRAIIEHAPALEVVAEVEDGMEVVAYLSGEGLYADRSKYPLPELIILDVRMPRMTGIEVLEWLEKRDYPSLKIAMLADSSAILYKEKARSLGLQHFYSKVINPAELIQVVKTLEAELENGTARRFV